MCNPDFAKIIQKESVENKSLVCIKIVLKMLRRYISCRRNHNLNYHHQTYLNLYVKFFFQYFT